MSAPLIKLSNGVSVPQIALGTAGTKSKDPIKRAIELGYRHIDTAYSYQTEIYVGEAIKDAIAEGIVKREDLFVTTKLPTDHHEIEKVVPSCKESLKNLGLDYIDSYLIHWPVALRKVPDPKDPTKQMQEPYDHDYLETWKGMEQCYKLGLVKSIGVSNCDETHLKRILDVAEIKPTVNQIKVDPLQNQKRIISFCKANGIQVTAYSSLRCLNKPDFQAHLPQLEAISKKYNRTVSQVILRYIVEIGVIPVSKSNNEDRLQQNLGIFNLFRLTDEDMAFLDSLNKLEAGVPAAPGPRPPKL